ncbi:hypothetical protein [Burkholderia gladioli]|uniref:hypothetical protein n=1 Tax=Burkholderia gladioli TaxID=28095 RepID=UPI001642B179|nr:hypothetical protein [Burkholderia gladioli]
MKDTANNIALGLGVAVLGFALYRYFSVQAGAGQGAAAAAGSTAASGSGGALWQGLTFPLGTATGGVNMNGTLDQVYSSTSWNPDAISALIGQDTIAAMGAAGQSTLNSWGFHL